MCVRERKEREGGRERKSLERVSRQLMVVVSFLLPFGTWGSNSDYQAWAAKLFTSFCCHCFWFVDLVCFETKSPSVALAGPELVM